VVSVYDFFDEGGNHVLIEEVISILTLPILEALKVALDVGDHLVCPSLDELGGQIDRDEILGDSNDKRLPKRRD